ncbi:hypothetical protein [Citrobacter freundii]|uniref:tail fiber/spike domain-containing protein n=1 Tax=Citrobacter freundii TaxID=546 RepID=UPI001FFDFB18|nr:hypothetical protein [Citrobacter freundii]
MSTTPTNLPVPSEKPQDLKFNAGKIDEFVTSMAQQYIDRFGQAHYTIEGLRWVAQQAISAFGYITLDSFEDGNTLTLPNQVLRLEATGEYYRWDGAFPKVVPTGSTPENSGGIGVGKWLSVGDASLRSNLATNNGSAMIGTSTGQTVEDRFKELEKYRVSSLLSDPNDDAGLAIMNAYAAGQRVFFVDGFFQQVTPMLFTNTVTIVGLGQQKCSFDFQPTIADQWSIEIKPPVGGSIAYPCLSKFSISSSDTSITKHGIFLNGNHSGGREAITKAELKSINAQMYDTAKSCIGFKINGVESFVADDLTGFIARPMVLGSTNDNTATNSGGDLDICDFTNLYLNVDQSSSNKAIEVLSGTSLSNVRFDTLSTTGAVYGFHFVKSGTNNKGCGMFSISNWRNEQPTDGNGYGFYVRGSASNKILRINLENVILGGQNGILVSDAYSLSLKVVHTNLKYGPYIDGSYAILLDGVDSLDTEDFKSFDVTSKISMPQLHAQIESIGEFNGLEMPVNGVYSTIETKIKYGASNILSTKSVIDQSGVKYIPTPSSPSIFTFIFYNSPNKGSATIQTFGPLPGKSDVFGDIVYQDTAAPGKVRIYNDGTNISIINGLPIKIDLYISSEVFL